MPELSRLPRPVTESWDWQMSGLCRGMDSVYFFHAPNERGSARDRREAMAKAICRRCPVMEKCREHALEVHETFGIWGGLGESELRAMLSERARK
ncbi:WhiB family transcriptional regulator [Saccharothrix sp. NRRL B-16314]|uniref:WhiB family transcriptional regulator n=1 Tax=Saccharothrix sp. NRRL B-16314 TaxID=1463825 RepID=UPI00052755C2|nr:WhiB family transcriptional regulator [Saccharothrix sp. NRRL B-16314]